MADTDPTDADTDTPDPDTDAPAADSTSKGRPIGVAVIAAVVVAIVALIAITASGGDDDSSAGEDDPAAASTEAGTATTSPDDTEATTAVDATTPAGPSSTPTTDSDGSPTTDDITVTTAAGPAATVVASSLPTTATITATDAPTTTTATAAPPPTTVSATPTPTTIVVTLPPELTTTVPPPPPQVDECTVLGGDEFGDILVQLTVVSPSEVEEVSRVGAEFIVNDAAGETIVADLVVLEFMSPGEVARVSVETFEPVPSGSDVAALSCLIDSVETAELLEEQVLPSAGDACSVLGVDDIGDLQLTATVRNPASEELDLVFTFAIRDSRGVRVVSDVGFADGVGPGQVVTEEVDTLSPPPAGVDVATLTCDIVGIDLF